jgi:hypothetical protein
LSPCIAFGGSEGEERADMRCEGSGGEWREREVEVVVREAVESSTETGSSTGREREESRKKRRKKNEEVVRIVLLRVASFPNICFSSRRTLCVPRSTRLVLLLPPLPSPPRPSPPQCPLQPNPLSVLPPQPKEHQQQPTVDSTTMSCCRSRTGKRE